MTVTFDQARPLLEVQTARVLGKIGISSTDIAVASYIKELYARTVRTFFKVEEAGESAVAELHRLDWDSDIYGMEIGAVGAFVSSSHDRQTSSDANLAMELAGQLASFARSQPFTMLVARVGMDDLVWVQALERVGFQVMDVQCPLVLTTSTRRMNNGVGQPQTKVEIRDCKSGDIPEILAFATSAFGRSHLYADALLPTQVSDQLYEAWIKNDCSGRASFVLVALINDRVCGLVAGLWDDCQERLLGVKRGHIDLIAVRSNMRKLGIARQLMTAALSRYSERGAALVTVSTQTTNLAAIGLYLNLGFRLTGFEITLHGWIERSHARGSSDSLSSGKKI